VLQRLAELAQSEDRLSQGLLALLCTTDGALRALDHVEGSND
jgi:hypothetical protein